MKTLHNEELSRHVTMRVGGAADTLLLPETEEEFIQAYSDAHDQDIPVFLLGRGSNTIFRDKGFHGVIIKTARASTNIYIKEVNRKIFRKKYLVEVGASVVNQSFLRFCKDNNLAGPTYLQSVPGNVGGSIYMNAGTGIDEGQAISDTIKEVRIFDGEKIITMPKQSCNFMFRHSVFHEKDWIILSALFELEPKSRKKVEKELKNRMKFVKKWQDLGYPNAGSVFKKGYQHIDDIPGKQIGRAMFSKKSANWIINLGGASSTDVLSLVDWAIERHIESGYERPTPEWIVR